MRTHYFLAAWLAMPVQSLLATPVWGGGLGREKPVAAVVIEDEGPARPDEYVAAYRVMVTADHLDFMKGTEIRIYLSAETKVLRGTGKDAKATPPGGWSKGTKIHFSRYDGIQQSRPPNVYPELVVLGGLGK